MKLHQLAAILAASRVSRRSARALANTHGLGGGAGDLSRTLELIEAHAERDEIYRLAITALAMPSPLILALLRNRKKVVDAKQTRIAKLEKEKDPGRTSSDSGTKEGKS